MVKSKMIERKKLARFRLAQWKNTKLCADCGTTKDLTLHHINPKRDGGSYKRNNLAVLCRRCHNEENKKETGNGRQDFVNKNKYWSNDEIYDLMELRKCGYTYDELSEIFNRSISALQTMVHNIKLGVDKISMSLGQNQEIERRSEI